MSFALPSDYRELLGVSASRYGPDRLGLVVFSDFGPHELRYDYDAREFVVSHFNTWRVFDVSSASAICSIAHRSEVMACLADTGERRSINFLEFLVSLEVALDFLCTRK